MRTSISFSHLQTLLKNIKFLHRKSNKIRIGPITKAHAKLLEQQVNSLLVESDIYSNESFILSKSLYVCMIRFIEDGGIVRGSEELQLKEHDMVIHEDSTREERESRRQG
jgi:hypothetical protein